MLSGVKQGCAVQTAAVAWIPHLQFAAEIGICTVVEAKIVEGAGKRTF